MLIASGAASQLSTNDLVAPSAAILRMSAPRAPVLGWSSFRGARAAGVACVDDGNKHVLTTSGRAAIYHALRCQALPEGSEVLVPTYHCPTMVAPVFLAGLVPRYFPIDGAGLPEIQALRAMPRPLPRVLLAAHYFGLPQSMADLRQWCDENQVCLIEDCAHSLFGQAGERPVGRWGDWATASISKFLPVPEAGVLASNSGAPLSLRLHAASLRTQVKGIFDVVELGARHGRLPGLQAMVRTARWIKRGTPDVALQEAPAVPALPTEAEMMRGCDMARLDERPLWISRWISRGLPRAEVVRGRRRNYLQYLDALDAIPGTRMLRPTLTDTASPYVFPLWVDDADRVYHALRHRSAPVFRWDRLWARTPDIPGDHGRLWSRHVLQLLCHQDLGHHEINAVCTTVRELCTASAAPVPQT